MRKPNILKKKFIISPERKFDDSIVLRKTLVDESLLYSIFFYYFFSSTNSPGNIFWITDVYNAEWGVDELLLVLLELLEVWLLLPGDAKWNVFLRKLLNELVRLSWSLLLLWLWFSEEAIWFDITDEWLFFCIAIWGFCKPIKFNLKKLC